MRQNEHVLGPVIERITSTEQITQTHSLPESVQEIETCSLQVCFPLYENRQEGKTLSSSRNVYQSKYAEEQKEENSNANVNPLQDTWSFV